MNYDNDIGKGMGSLGALRMKIKKLGASKLETQKLVYGVGINDADYVVRRMKTIKVNGKRKQKLVWECPYYRVWKAMLQRCYSIKTQDKNPSYKGCSVSEEIGRASCRERV